jgi:hypothetical protein
MRREGQRGEGQAMWWLLWVSKSPYKCIEVQCNRWSTTAWGFKCFHVIKSVRPCIPSIHLFFGSQPHPCITVQYSLQSRLNILSFVNGFHSHFSFLLYGMLIFWRVTNSISNCSKKDRTSGVKLRRDGDGRNARHQGTWRWRWTRTCMWKACMNIAEQGLSWIH